MVFLYGGIALLLVALSLSLMLLLRIRQARHISGKPNCCHCGSLAMHISAPNGVPDKLLTYWNCFPHRCEVCFHRQYRLAVPHMNDDS